MPISAGPGSSGQTFSTAADLTTHAADTTSVHGITDTSALMTLTSSNAAYVRQDRRALNLRDLCTPTGSNDTTVVNAALATFDAAGGGVLRVNDDGWVFTGSTGLALTSTSNPLHLMADPGTVFDFTGSTATTALTLGGALGTSAALGADAAKGARTITCALSVSAGDVIQLQSSAVFADSNVKGEMVEVQSSAAGVITLKSSLWDSYTSATTTVYKLTAPRVSVSGLTILRNSDHAGLTVQYARDVLLDNVRVEGSRERGVYLNTVYGGVVRNCHGRDFWYSGTGTSYGLSVASSQHIMEIGNDFRGGRHAITHGGTYPCRDIQVIGGTFDNYHQSSQAAVDFHPNCENVRMVGVTSLNGVVSGAGNFAADGCTVRRSSYDSADAVELTPYRSSEYITWLRGDVQVTDASADAVSLVARNGSNATTTKVVEIGGYIAGGASGVGVRVSAASSSDTGSSVESLTIRGDVSGGQAVAMTKTTSAEIDCGTTTLTGRFTGQTTSVVTVTSVGGDRLILDGAELLNLTAGQYCYNGASTGSMDVIVRNSRLAGSGVTSYSSRFGAGRLVMQNSTIEALARSVGSRPGRHLRP